MNYHMPPRGLTLLETIFAIAVLLIAVIAVLGLALASVRGERESETLIVANNLAREGIEVVRAIRDTNFLLGQAWDVGLAGDYSAVPVQAYDSGSQAWGSQWSLDFNPDAPVAVDIDRGVFNHQSVGDDTLFSRLIEFQDVCLRPDGVEDVRLDCGTYTKIGLRVSSHVVWQDQGRNRQITLYSLLYAWK